MGLVGFVVFVVIRLLNVFIMEGMNWVDMEIILGRILYWKWCCRFSCIYNVLVSKKVINMMGR